MGACPEDVDYRAPVRPRQGAVPEPAQRQMDHRKAQLHPRPCGVGKTWLGCTLAQAACRNGMTVVYKLTNKLSISLFGRRYDRKAIHDIDPEAR